MTDLNHGPPLRDDMSAIARWAAESVPVRQSARRRSVGLLAPFVIPLCVFLPLLHVGTAVAMAGVIALTVVIRLAALVHVLRGAPLPDVTDPERLPRITVLLPLREEVPVVEGLVSAVSALDYPAELIEVVALVEADDPATLNELRVRAPSRWKLVMLPPGSPETKARACNVGLALSRSEILVVFDGEDRPEPDQARKAVAALAADTRLAVVQARLGCDHAGSGSPYLARFWALEYAVLFGAIQPALARLGLPFLLGGTSNWFRTSALREVGGWDAHNVTEDADLGVRLARAGWRSSVIDSTTWEEAPIHLGQWLRQRSRWLKGFATTSVVLLLSAPRVWRELGPAAALAAVGQLPATVVCAAVHPVGLCLIVVHWGELLSLIGLGGYSVSLALTLAVARREGISAWLVPWLPVYWLLQTGALALAAAELVRSPSRWRKTPHGLVERPNVVPSARQRRLVRTAPLAEAVQPNPANAQRKPAAARWE